ncbi:MAG: hypothetical protein HY689_01195 [Chloroflexi bacterium]|nr:hypothetical protein [Chloroflexota bacterium]
MSLNSRRAWPWLGGTLAVAVGLASLPYLVAWLLTPPDMTFSGLLVHVADGYSYLAKMRQGAAGAWLIHLPYIPQDHPPALLFPYHVLLGHLARWSGLPLIVVYHGARVLGGAALVVALYGLAAALLPDRGLRRTAVLIAVFTSGLGWLTLPWGHLTPDLVVPESNVLYAMLANAHFPPALAALAAALGGHHQAIATGRWRWAWMAGGAAALAVLLQPFLALTIGAVVCARLLLTARWERRLPLREAVLALPLALLPAPVLAAAAVSLLGDPALRATAEQHVMLSPPPWDYLIGYGLPGAAAVAGAVLLWRKPQAAGGDAGARALLLAWFLVGALLLYVPLPFQRRLSIGYALPLALLAAIGVHRVVWPWLRERRGGRAALAALVVLSLPSTLAVLVLPVPGALGLREPFYIAAHDQAAFAWLEATIPRDAVVLAGPRHGNQVPALAGTRVFWGHPFETPGSEERLAAVRRFFSGDWSEEERRAWLLDTPIAFVYYGMEEQQLGPWDPDRADYLRPVFARGPVRVYRVVR